MAAETVAMLFEVGDHVKALRAAYDDVMRMKWGAEDAKAAAEEQQKRAKNPMSQAAANEAWRDAEALEGQFNEALAVLEQTFATVAGWMQESPENVDGLVKAIKDSEARQAGLKLMADSYYRKAKGEEAFQDHIKQQVRDLLEASGEKIVQGQDFRFQLQANTQASVTLLVDEKMVVDAGFGEVVTTYKPDKRRLAKAIKDGDTAAAELADIRVGNHVRVY